MTPLCTGAGGGGGVQFQFIFVLFYIYFNELCYLNFFMCSLQIADVKLQIEKSQGQDVYPSAQQMLIHQGKVLKDSMTLEENNVTENSFLVIMLTKVRDSLLQKVLVNCLCYFFVDVQVDKQLVRLFRIFYCICFSFKLHHFVFRCTSLLTYFTIKVFIFCVYGTPRACRSCSFLPYADVTV